MAEPTAAGPPDPTPAGSPDGASPAAQRPGRDAWWAVRRTVAQCVIAFTVLFLLPLLRAVAGVDDGRATVHRSAAAWAVWCAGLALMVAGALFAVQSLRAKQRPRSIRFAWWCGGLWLAGFVLTVVYSTMVGPPK